LDPTNPWYFISSLIVDLSYTLTSFSARSLMASETLIIGFGINHPAGGLKPEEAEVVPKKGNEAGTNGNGKNGNGNGGNGAQSVGSSGSGPKGKEIVKTPTVVGVSFNLTFIF
jgi:hypothetical protein